MYSHEGSSVEQNKYQCRIYLGAVCAHKISRLFISDLVVKLQIGHLFEWSPLMFLEFCDFPIKQRSDNSSDPRWQLLLCERNKRGVSTSCSASIVMIRREKFVTSYTLLAKGLQKGFVVWIASMLVVTCFRFHSSSLIKCICEQLSSSSSAKAF